VPRAPAPLLRHLRTLLDAPALARRTDRELLDAFATRRDEAAFAALVRRHGPMVLNVCRHVLRHEQDAEDAFQATFLVLARKAASLGSVVSIVGWLHGVAHRTALSARKSAARRQAHASPPLPPEPVQPVTEAALHELQALLDAEVARLPEKLRAPFVLCCLEGHSKSEAARELGWKQGTLSSRLAEARERLRARLIRRGVTLSAALAAVALTEATSCAARSEALARAALTFATGQGSVNGVSHAAVRLACNGLTTAGTTAWKMAAMLLLAAGLAAGATAVVRATGSAVPRSAPVREDPQDNNAGRPAESGDRQTGKDRYGDPLPAGAIARLGTARLRHGFATYDAALSPDGKLLASAGAGRGVCVWDAATGKELHAFLPKWDQYVHHLAFSPDSKLLAGGDGPVYLWDMATGKELRRFTRKTEEPPALVAFSPDGNLLAAVGGRLVQLWDVATGQQVKQLEGPDTHIYTLAFAPDGKMLATTHGDENLRLWDVDTGTELHRLLCPPPDLPAPHPFIAFSPDGKLLASAPFGKMIHLLDPQTGAKVRSWECDSPRTGGLAFSPDGKVLVSGGHDGDLRLWDPTTGKELRRWQTHGLLLSSVAFSKDGTKLVTTAYQESGPRLWDVATGKELLKFAGHDGVIEALTITPDGKSLLSGGRDQVVLRWDLATGKETQRFAVHSAASAHLAFAADGKSMLSVTVPDGAVRVWDVPSGKEVQLLDKIGKQLGNFLPTSLALAPDGRLAAAVKDDKAVHIWDLVSGKQLRRFGGGGGSITSVAFSPDSKRLAAASGGPNSKVGIWDIERGFLVWTKSTGSVNGPMGVIFSPDGNQLVTFAWDGQVCLWDIATTKEVRSFGGGRGSSGQACYSAAFSPDGRSLATAGGEDDKRVCVWEVRTGLEVRTFRGHVTAVGSVAFSPDGRTVVSGGADSMIYMWDVTGRVKDGRIQPLDLTERDLDERWRNLASSDGPRAVQAMWDLATNPKVSVPFLRKMLRQPEAVEEKQLKKLIADLDSEQFDVRSSASRALERLGESAEAALRQTLAGNPSVEMKQRIEQLLTKLGPGSPQRLRESRAVQALEYAGSSEARQALETLAQGPATALTREAKTVLNRLAGRTK
jgi:RNA polymerase sigma factor (sigma-70 family)